MYGYEVKEKFPERCKTVDELAIFLTNRSEGHPNFSILLGAGASQTSGVKTGRDLVSKWRKDYYLRLSNETVESYTEEKAKDWLTENCSDWYNSEREYSSLFERIFDTPLQRRIFVEGQVKDAVPSVGYAYLARLINEKYINTIFTTNFDDLVNESLYRFGDTRPIVCAHDSSVEGILVTSPRPKIIKLHGDYLFDDLKCTVNDTDTLDQNMKEKFTQFLREYGLIIMGYSGEDKSIMDVINSLLDNPSYMRNGLYWCIREQSYISKGLVDLLEKQRAYVVMIDGYDDALASICNEISSTKSPIPEFSSRSNDANIVKSWLDKKDVYYSESKVIQDHLKYLESTQDKSQLAEALADLHSDSQNHSRALEQFNDQQVTSLVQLKKMYNQGDYTATIDAAESMLNSSSDTDFNQELLLSIYSCWKEIGDREKAKDVCSQLQKIDPKNPVHLLREFNVEANFTKRKRLFDKALEKDRYYWAIHYRYAEHLFECVSNGVLPTDRGSIEEIIEHLKMSIDCRPSFRNPAWKLLFETYIKGKGFLDLSVEMKGSIENLRRQDPYSPKVLSAIFDYCKEKENERAYGESIFELIDNASINYFPNYSPNLLRVAVDASIEFGKHEYAYNKIDEIENNTTTMDALYQSYSYVLAKADFLLDVHQDIKESIAYVEEAAKRQPNTNLHYKLIRLYCFDNKCERAEEIYRKYEQDFDREDRAVLLAKILESKGDYSGAISSYDKLKDEPYFDEKYGARKSYVYLLSNDYDKAKKCSSSILDKYNWDSDNFGHLIINYEYACSKLDKAHKKRLSNLLETSGSKNVKAMAHLLLGNEVECLDIMKSQVKKEFSWYFEYRTWPVAESIMPRLSRELGIQLPEIKIVS